MENHMPAELRTVALGQCGICGDSRSRPAGSYLMDVPGHPFTGSRWHLQRCETCGLVYVDPRPTSQIFGGFVADPERDLASKGHWRGRLKKMSTLGGRGALLDVGCGAGAFLHYARSHGWDVVGLDVQPEFARDVERRLGIPVHVGEIGDAEIQAQQFDAVTMWDVIEHVPRVRETLRSAAAIVRPGGLLALSTINAGSFNARLFGASWVFWNRPGTVPEHLQGFTLPSIHRALKDAGFDVQYTRSQFASGAIVEPLGRSVRLDRLLGRYWPAFRHSVPGRAAAFALWRTAEWIGRPLDLWRLGDMLEVFAVRRADSAEDVEVPARG